MRRPSETLATPAQELERERRRKHLARGDAELVGEVMSRLPDDFCERLVTEAVVNTGAVNIIYQLLRAAGDDTLHAQWDEAETDTIREVE